MLRLIVVFLFFHVFSAANEMQNEGLPDPAWERFKRKFDKLYESSEEEHRRLNAWQKNCAYINAENAKGHSYVLGENQFSDQTRDEFFALKLGFEMPAHSVLYGGIDFLGNHTFDGQALPGSVDWTARGAVTEIKNQGQCGSCWVFSAVGAMEGAYQIASGKLVSLAEQQIVDCDHQFFPPTMGCSGGSMAPAFEFAKTHGICTESSYPYEAKNDKCHAANCTIGLPQGKVVGYKGLAPVARIVPASETAMMSAVAQQPVSVAIAANSDIFMHYKSGVIDGNCGQLPDHGVLVVGYGTDPSGEEYWKVKNSWGASWGEDGYVRIKRGRSWRGECAILNSPSYPVVSKTNVVV